ncbi:TIGR03663 family protein [Bdellovibrio sp. KM01]|uniref:TIGR03663 family protein n=1 Tax=Bdellovibrio sp. KM01 TaxID=2748865 RepID=UPI0015EA3367|nr:TIGR03663 family protein [Bdellovibrio sp. KM01]QLY24503.1 TIGR03663 family protein [Bdellovibrio sp. KM01]
MKSIRVTQIQKYIIWLVILLLTVFSRFYLLTNKPLHFDEGINGWFVLQMKINGFYKYDPTNYHGPLYFYLLRAFTAIWGHSVEILRAVPAVFSVFSVMLFSFALIRSRAVRWSMLFFLFFSPAFLFYGRSGIHEMPFVFFQLLFALGMLRWTEKFDGTSLGLLLTGVVGMATLKETFAITLASWVVGLVFAGPAVIRQYFNFEKIKAAWSHRLTYMVVALLISFVLLFTGFLRNWPGLFDFIKAFLPWMKTGVGETGHNKEFLYWVKVLADAEPMVLFGVGMAFVGLFTKDARLRMVSAFSLFQLFVYSWIPYKTVWCILSLVWGFYFVLALYAEKILARRDWRGYLFGSIVLVGTLGSLRSDWRSVYSQPIDLNHPYIYVNSTYEMKDLQNLILQVAKDHPNLLTESVQIGMKEQWPFPWIYRSFKTHWDLCADRAVPDAWLYYCDTAGEANVESQLTEQFMKIRIMLRQQREYSVVYLKKSLFGELYTGAFQVVGPAKEKE